MEENDKNKLNSSNGAGANIEPEGVRSAAARDLAPSARGDGPDGRGPKSAVPVFIKVYN